MAQFWDTLFLAMTAGTCLFCLALITRDCLSEARWPSHAVALLGFFIIIFAEAATGLSGLAPSEMNFDWATGLTLPLVPALGAFIWFYIRGLTSSEQGFGRRDLWHAVPVAIIVACAVPFLMLPSDQQVSLLSYQIDMQNPHHVTAVISMMLGWIVWLAILILYGGASMRRLILHRAQIRELFSNVDGVSLAWINILMVIVVTFTILAIIGALLPATTNFARLTEALAAPFYFCLVFVVGSFGVLQKSVIPPWSELDPSSVVKQKYERSALHQPDLFRIAQKLDETMRGQQFWENPNLSLHDVSHATGVSQNNISQTLNDHLGKNFYDYVNGWRIKAACAALRDTDDSVLNISLDVGFNSKSTFNAAFKKVTGRTPRQFRIEINAPKKSTDGQDRTNTI
jgi:AraC-like DNA-binding protein